MTEPASPKTPSRPRDRRSPYVTPSRFTLPQFCSEDRLRARRATRLLRQEQYMLATDNLSGNPAEGFRLPRGAEDLPAAERFRPEKMFRLITYKAYVKLQAPVVNWVLRAQAMDTERDYVRLLGWMRRPTPTERWRTDAEFGRQRLVGTNPMAIHLCTDPPDDPLAHAANHVLEERYGSRLGAALDAGRLFRTSYPLLLDQRIQDQVHPGATLTAPECIFYVDDEGKLLPIGIQLNLAGGAKPSVVTPFDATGDWLMARSHAQSADAHYHETVYHLLETHMVSELFSLITARELHPDHPVSQLLTPHFEGNIAINHMARSDLLSVGGPIDTVLAAGVGGGLDLARLFFQDWSFRKRSFANELNTRGVENEKLLPGYTYRDDAIRVHRVIANYVDGMVALYYPRDELVSGDPELQAWARALGAEPIDFPKVATAADLRFVLTEIIFRASAQHAAVNLGQYDCFGFVPNTPGSLTAGVPDPSPAGRPTFDQTDVLRAMPSRDRAIGQLGMAWVLSEPTHRALPTAGESAAFAPEVNGRAYEVVQAFRMQLDSLAEQIQARNAKAGDKAYTFLDPTNVARSTQI